MNDKQNEMTREEAEEDFKNAVANAFSKRIPSAFRDKDGFVCIPKLRKKKKDSDTDNH